MRFSFIQLSVLVVLLILIPVRPAPSAQSQKAPRAEDVPTFSVRLRVVSASGRPPAGKRIAFHMRYTLMTAEGDSWMGPWNFDHALATRVFRGSYPVIVGLQVAQFREPLSLELEIKVDETNEMRTVRLDLLDSSFYLMAWREENGRARVETLAEYNRRYWKPLDGVDVPEGKRPVKYPVADRFIGDGTLQANEEGLRNLSRAGFSVIMLPPSAPNRDLLAKLGMRTAAAIYSPPGYAFDYTKAASPEAIQAWAEQQAAPYRKAGFKSGDPALFAMSDEPGWYYPTQLKEVQNNPEALARFRDYVKAQGLSSADVGASEWASVLPIGRSEGAEAGASLQKRRLFYWTMRFFAQDSARHFANCARALEKAFYPGMPIFTNWNFFAGRLYVPGPAANNPQKSSPDVAMGGHDWFEFGRMRGGTMLWTEDWFGDGLASQWSFYASRLRCAAEKSGIQFGGYVVPRSSGQESHGLMMRMMCLAGSGAKAITCYTFGPEYMFPGNCYSEKPEFLRQEAEANRLIGASEELLWPGKRPRSEVAILWPRSSQLWDIRGQVKGTPISDATNVSLNSATVDYMCEAYNDYCALQHANIPADFVDEDDLTEAALKPYRMLYVTEPNVPEEGQRAIAAWVRGGGSLVTVSGAATRDRYDDPCEILGETTGFREAPRERLLVGSTAALKEVGKGKGQAGEFTAVGVKGTLGKFSGQTVGKFDDDSPALVHRSVGRGRAIHFTWMPGISYAHSAGRARKLPAGYSGDLRNWICYPTTLAGVQRPVACSAELIETPILLSDKGAAVTLLNWNEESVPDLGLTVRLPFTPRTVKSARRGAVQFRATTEGVKVSLPLNTADVLMFYR